MAKEKNKDLRQSAIKVAYEVPTVNNYYFSIFIKVYFCT